jgi:hypothetical protein
MARIITFMGILTLVMAFSSLWGIPTVSSLILSAFGISNLNGTINPLEGSAWATIQTTIFGIGVVGGIIAGLYFRTNIESAIVATFASMLTVWAVGDMVAILNYVGSQCPVGSECYGIGIGFKLFWIVLIVVWFISVIQWWRGNDI